MNTERNFLCRIVAGCLFLMTAGVMPAVGQTVTTGGGASAAVGEATQAKAGPYVIEGRIKGVDEGAPLLLLVRDMNESTIIGQDTLRGGNFRFTGTVDKLTKMLVLGQTMAGWMTCWVRPGSTTVISGEGNLSAKWKIKSDVPEQAEENRYTDVGREQSLLNEQCSEELRPLYKSLSMQDSVPPRVVMLQKTRDSANLARAAKELEMLKIAPVSVVWMDKLTDQVSRIFYYPGSYPHRDEVVALYNGLDQQWKQSDAGREMAEKLFAPKVVKIGEAAPDGELADTTGAMRRLLDFREPGKYMVLDFWAVGCGPCLMAVPEMKEVADLYRDRIVVVGINLDAKKYVQQWKEKLVADGITWPSLNEPKGGMGKLPLIYGIKGTPRYVVISPEGKVVARWNGYGPGSFKEHVEKAILPKEEAAAGEAAK